MPSAYVVPTDAQGTPLGTAANPMAVAGVSGGTAQPTDLTKVGGAAVALGQALAAASLPVVLTAAQVTSLTAPALAAGENHVGEVADPRDVIIVTPVCDTSAYATGDTLFDATAVAGAVRVSGGKAVLQSVVVIDKDDQTAAQIDLFFFDASVTFGTLNAAPGISDADAAKCLGIVSVLSTDFIDVGGAKIACVKNVGLTLKPATGTSVYVAAITRGSPTQTASGIVLRLGVVQS